MKSFKEFLNEFNINTPFRAGTQFSGHLDLPDLRNLKDFDEAPPDGWSSIRQLTGAQIQKHQLQSADMYIYRDTLEKFKALAENIISAISLHRSQGNVYSRHHYSNASYNSNLQKIYGLAYSDIIGGDYPRLRNEEMQRGKELKIIEPDPNQQGYWILDVEKLRNEMTQLKIKLRNNERGYESMHTMANKAEKLAASVGSAFQSSLQSKWNNTDFTRAS